MKTERSIGAGVLALGLGMLLFVFYTGYRMLVDPTILACLSPLLGSSEVARGLSCGLGIAILWVMGGLAGKAIRTGMELMRARGGGGDG